MSIEQILLAIDLKKRIGFEGILQTNMRFSAI
jgi:hypothetical protein